jgi:hypothetical protein
MYSLKVIKHLEHPDGRLFEPGHDCHALSAFEVAELVVDYPGYFEAADDVTQAFMENKENVGRLAEARKKQVAEQNKLMVDAEITRLEKLLKQLKAEKGAKDE